MKDPHQALKIQQGIRNAENKLVEAIQSALDKKASYGDLKASQFRNLVRVADTTESTEVIKNFLLYQVGREKLWGRGKDSLAQQIIHHIDHKLKELADGIAEAAQSTDSRAIRLG